MSEVSLHEDWAHGEAVDDPLAGEAMTAPAEAGVALVLDTLAWEIELAGARCLKLDAIVSTLMHNLPPDQVAPLVEGMHAIDLVSQHLTGLSSFARELSRAAPDDVRLPIDGALESLTLGALADRLGAALGAEEKNILDGDASGDLDLF
jgi:hypothetical protein